MISDLLGSNQFKTRGVEAKCVGTNCVGAK